MKICDAWQWLFGFSLVCSAACVPAGPVVPLSPQAQAVRVDKGEPPPGARLVSAVEATAGHGCGIDADRGTLNGAMAALKEAAARQGMNFVKLTKESKPYSGHDCVHGEYTLSGLGYRVGQATVPPVVPTASVACLPPCAPGYLCSAGQCQPQCEPGCAAGQICRADRVCAAVAP